MPVDAPTVDLQRSDEAAPLPNSWQMRAGEAFGHWDFGQGVIHDIVTGIQGQTEFQYQQAGLPFSDPTFDRQVDAETLNRQYGVPGYLRFNAPASENDAAFQSHMANERRFRDEIFANSNPNPLLDLGLGLAGAVTDPANIALAAATGGLGEGVLGLAGLGEAGETGLATTWLARGATAVRGAPRALAVGAIDNAPLVAANAMVSRQEGDDYGFPDALRDIAAGAVLHSTLHTALRATGLVQPKITNPGGLDEAGALAEARAGLAATRAEMGASELPEPLGADIEAPARRLALFTSASGRAITTVQEALDELPAPVRLGAWAKALDEATGDQSVDVGRYVQSALEARGVRDAEPEAVRPPSEPEAPAAEGVAPDEPGPIEPTRAEQTLDTYFLGREEGAKAPRPVHAIVDAQGRVIDWSTAKAAAERSGKYRPEDGHQIVRVARDDWAGRLGERLGPTMARQIIGNLNDHFARNDPGQLDTVRPPGPSAAAPARSPVVDLEPSMRGPLADPGEAATARGQAFIAADPELRELAEDTVRFEASRGVKLAEPDPKLDPERVAAAVRAAAMCAAGTLPQ